ncbi:MAG: SurA N-terminal domain-containing protein [Endomicrobia bacterium]|nr:SurA N-terminal domain-containing protein [Endomicrobiia bacterium]
MNIFEFFRKNKQNILIITTIGFIGGIFLGFGGYYIRDFNAINNAAVVNGVKIPISRYNRLVSQSIENYRNQNNDITDEVIKSIKQQVLRDLIQEEVFWQEAKKYGIKVTDQELYSYIMSIPAFQKNGIFDRETYYKTVILRLKMTPKEFEESQRKRIAMFKLREFIVSGVKLSKKEIEEYYKLRNPKTEEDKQKLYKELLQEKQTAVLEEWYKQINNNLKVKVYIKDL